MSNADKFDAETESMLQHFDDGTMTQEEAMKRIHDAIDKMPTKVVHTQDDIDEFYDD